MQASNIELDIDTLIEYVDIAVNGSYGYDELCRHLERDALESKMTDIIVNILVHESRIVSKAIEAGIIKQERELTHLLFSTENHWKLIDVFINFFNSLESVPKSEKARILLNAVGLITKRVSDQARNFGISYKLGGFITQWLNLCGPVLPQMLRFLRINAPEATDQSVLDIVQRPLFAVPTANDAQREVIEIITSKPVGHFRSPQELNPFGWALLYLIEPNSINWWKFKDDFIPSALNTLVSAYENLFKTDEFSSEAIAYSASFGESIGAFLVSLPNQPDSAIYLLSPKLMGITGRGEIGWNQLTLLGRFELKYPLSRFLHNSDASKQIFERLRAINFPFHSSGIIDGVSRGLMNMDSLMNRWVKSNLDSYNPAMKTLAQMLKDQGAYPYAVPCRDARSMQIERDSRGAIKVRNDSKSTLLEQLASYGLCFSFDNLATLGAYEIERSLKEPLFVVPVADMAKKTNQLCRAFYKYKLSRELTRFDSNGKYTHPDKPDAESAYVQGLDSVVMAIRSYLFLHEKIAGKYLPQEKMVILSQGTIDLTIEHFLPFALQAHFSHLNLTIYSLDADFVLELLPIFTDFVKNKFPTGLRLTVDTLSESMLEEEASTPKTFTPAKDSSTEASGSTNDISRRTNTNSWRKGCTGGLRGV